MRARIAVTGFGGAVLASILAAIPYWIFLDVNPVQAWNFLRLSLLGVFVIGVPLGAGIAGLLSKNGELSLASLTLSAILTALVLFVILLLAVGFLAAVFLPGLVIAAITLALTFWYWITRPYRSAAKSDDA